MTQKDEGFGQKREKMETWFLKMSRKSLESHLQNKHRVLAVRKRSYGSSLFFPAYMSTESCADLVNHECLIYTAAWREN